MEKNLDPIDKSSDAYRYCQLVLNDNWCVYGLFETDCKHPDKFSVEHLYKAVKPYYQSMGM